MNLKKLKGQVEYCLKWNKETRDNDIVLLIQVWREFYNKYIVDEKIKVQDLHVLPREDNVKRIRASFQNTEGKYLPNSLEVVKKRGLNEQEWREFMGFNKNKNLTSMFYI